MKLEKKLLFAVLLLSAVMRCIALGSRGIWYDDAFSIFLSRLPLPSIVTGTAADTMPPLYYFLLHAWMVFGESIWLLRLLNVVFSVATVWLVYALVVRLLDTKAGLWAALLAAISPLQIYQSQEIRSYALLAVLQAGYALFFVNLWRNRQPVNRWNWVGLVICGTAAMYSHNLAIFTLIVPDILLLVKGDRRLLRKLILAQTVTALLFMPWLLYLPGQLAKVQHAWSIPRPGLAEILQAIIIFTSNLPLPGLLLAVALFLSMLGIVLVVFELVHEQDSNDGILALALFALVPPLLMLLFSYTVKPVFVTRGFIFSALAYDGIVGYVVAHRWPRIGVAIVAIFLMGAWIALPYQYIDHEFPRSQFEEAARYLENVIKPGDRVVDDNKLSGFPLRYYGPDLPETYLADIPFSENDTLALPTQAVMNLYPSVDLANAVGTSNRVYFVVFQRARQEYAALGQPVHPALAWLDQHYYRTGNKVFGDLEIYRFERQQADQ